MMTVMCIQDILIEGIVWSIKSLKGSVDTCYGYYLG